MYINDLKFLTIGVCLFCAFLMEFVCISPFNPLSSGQRGEEAFWVCVFENNQQWYYSYGRFPYFVYI